MNAFPTFAADAQLTLVRDHSRELYAEADAQRLAVSAPSRETTLASAVRLLRRAVSRPAGAPSAILPRLEDYPSRS